jgi:V8-like Glu-specific endopeptidase
VFGYQYNESGELNKGKQYACENVAKANKTLDYSILKIRGAPGNEWGTLPISTGTISDTQEIYIVQHPAGEPKQISKINCNVDEAIVNGRGTNTDLAHLCDTMGGSSGSPVLTLSHEVVGLHHFGIGQGPFWNRNRAVRIRQIMEDINN